MYVIELRNGGYFIDHTSDHSGNFSAAMKFSTREEAVTFINASVESAMSFAMNSGMVVERLPGWVVGDGYMGRPWGDGDRMILVAKTEAGYVLRAKDATGPLHFAGVPELGPWDGFADPFAHAIGMANRLAGPMPMVTP